MTTETQEDLVERVTGYIKYNATKDNAAVLKLIEDGHAQLMALLDGVSDDQAAFKPGADEWSVLDTMRHVVAAKKGTARICATLARGDKPQAVGGEGEDVRRQDGVVGREFASLAEAVAAVNEAHDQLVAFVNEVSDASNTDVTHKHFVFGDLNCREWAVFQRVHDGDHAGQIEKIKSSDGFSPS